MRDFTLVEGPEEESLTARAGLTMVAQAFASSGARAVADKVIKKRRARGFAVSDMLQSLIVLIAAGADRCEDLFMLQEDQALATLLGHAFPAPQTARDFLEQFDQEREELPLLLQGDKASIYDESPGLRGLLQVHRQIVGWQQANVPCTQATLDVDATIIESSKKAALRSYEGERGYQPTVVYWPEADLILYDQFRDGNVPAGCGNEHVIETALTLLPTSITQRYLRGDSALYETDVLKMLQKQSVLFAISAKMSAELKAAVEQVADADWTSLGSDEITDGPGTMRSCAEVDFTPVALLDKMTNKYPRYLAIRVTKKQGELFDDGVSVRHFAVVTNRTGSCQEILAWHRKKAGTIEHVHHVMKNELAAGAMPSGKFGANAAWFRINVLVYNLLSALKKMALPKEYALARPKRLRFAFFNTIGRTLAHARTFSLRVAKSLCALLRYALNELRRSKSFVFALE